MNEHARFDLTAQHQENLINKNRYYLNAVMKNRLPFSKT